MTASFVAIYSKLQANVARNTVRNDNSRAGGWGGWWHTSGLEMPESEFNERNEKPVSVKNDLRNVIMKEDFVQLLMTCLRARHVQRIYFQSSVCSAFQRNVGG